VQEQNKKKTRAKDVLPNIHHTLAPAITPRSNRMVLSAVVCCCVMLFAASTFHSIAAGGWWQCWACFCPWWPWPLTLTFKLVWARDQARLPFKFGANPFSDSGDNWGKHRRKQTNKKVTDGAKNKILLACCKKNKKKHKNWPLVRFAVSFWSLQLNFQALWTDLKSIHGLNRCLCRAWAFKAHKSYTQGTQLLYTK